MFTRWGGTVFRHRWTTIALGAVFAALAAVWGAGVLSSLSAGGFADRDSEAARATRLLESTGRSTPDVVVVYEHRRLTVDDAAYRVAVSRSLDALPQEHVLSARSYWSTDDERLVSADRHLTYASLVLAGGDDTERAADYAAVEDRLDVPGFNVLRGGPEAVFSDVSDQVAADIKHAELVSMPLVLVLCVLIYGSVVAASLPLLVGGLAVLGALAAVRTLTAVTDVSVFSLNIITLLGLGLAIDYALFVVTRFREELARVDDVEAAVVTTVATAGRTIVWSGLTVALSLASLLLFPQVFLRSMGIGGVAAVVVAMTAALTVLPAVLGVLGHRVDSWRLLRRRGSSPRGRRAASSSAGSRWSGFAHLVMRRPFVFVTTGLVVLLALGAPFLGATFGGVDERALPATTESRVASETIAEEFPGAGTSVAEIVTTGLDELQLRGLAATAENLPGVAAVTTQVNDGAASVVQVAYSAEAQSAEARHLVEALRELPVPTDGTALVRGETAELVDLLASLSSILPWMALTVAVTTFLLLFAAFGSVVVPLKAIAMAAVSLCASFGVVVWVFQDGHGSGWLGFTETGYVDATQPILMLAVLFGLSMDYELFLLSRVREEWDRSQDNTHAVAVGLQRTGRIITSAALLLIVVVAGFSTSGITFIKMMGVGMIVALVVDATLVRAVLVPATMRLLGSANWYAPPRLARWWATSGLQERDLEDEKEPLSSAGPAPARGGGVRQPPRHRAARRQAARRQAARPLTLRSALGPPARGSRAPAPHPAGPA